MISRPTIIRTICFRGRLGAGDGADVTAVAQRRDPVGDAEDLLQPVGDVDDGDPPRLQTAHDRKSRSASCLLNADVGSSRISSFAWCDSACAIATSCRWAIGRSPARAEGRISTPS